MKNENAGKRYRRLEERLNNTKLKIPKMPELTFCPHIDYCVVVSGGKCLFNKGWEGCRIAQFYDRNPNYGEGR